MPREQDLQVVIANADYEMSKVEAVRAGFPHTVTCRIVERRNRLKAGSLKNYRDNHYSRRTR